MVKEKNNDNVKRRKNQGIRSEGYLI